MQTERELKAAIAAAGLATPEEVTKLLAVQDAVMEAATQADRNSRDENAAELITQLKEGKTVEEALTGIAERANRDRVLADIADRTGRILNARIVTAYNRAVPSLYKKAEKKILAAVETLNTAASKLPEPMQQSMYGMPTSQEDRYTSDSYAAKVLQADAGAEYTAVKNAANFLVTVSPLVTRNGFTPRKEPGVTVDSWAGLMWFEFPEVPPLDQDGTGSDARKKVAARVLKAAQGPGFNTLIDIARGTVEGVSVGVSTDHDVLADRAESIIEANRKAKVLHGGPMATDPRWNEPYNRATHL